MTVLVFHLKDTLKIFWSDEKIFKMKIEKKGKTKKLCNNYQEGGS